MEPQLSYVNCPDSKGTHRMAYWSHGAQQHEHVIICVHGISRQGRDFDVLARQLTGAHGQRCRVVSVDIVGRGMSDWLHDPMGYVLPQYIADMAVLIAKLREQGAQVLDWVGTSMGGLIGMGICAKPQSGIRRFVLNDIGPVIEPQALERISCYLGADPRFESEAQALDYITSISQSFGPHTREQWAALTRPLLRTADDGRLRLHYDPQIAMPLKAATPESVSAGQALLWQWYDAMRCETLLIRGADSDLILPQTVRHMQSRGPKPSFVEFSGVGHAPTLMAQDQVEAVERFLWA